MIGRTELQTCCACQTSVRYLIATPEGLQHAFFLQLLSVADSLFLSLRAIIYLSHEETPSVCLLKMCSILHS